MTWEKRNKWVLATVITVSLAMIAISVVVAILIVRSLDNAKNITSPTGVSWPAPPNPQDSRYRKAAVASAQPQCSQIGTNMLIEGGSAVDAAIATTICIGVYKTLSCGIGGGSFMTYYDRSMRKSYVFDYREVAPLASNSTMYENSTLNIKTGPGSIAVPGEVAGLWAIHQRFGKLNWARLFEPSIERAERGIALNDYVYKFMKNVYDQFNDELRDIFTDSARGKPKEVGDIIKLPKLAETLRRIANDGASTFYNGTLRDDIVADLNDLGSIITKEDLEQYQVKERMPIKSEISNGGFTIISPPPPSGGVVVQYIMNILNGYNWDANSVSSATEDIESTVLTYHRMVEAMKFAYAMRSNLGDESFNDLVEHVANMTSEAVGEAIRKRIVDKMTQDVTYYGMDVDPRLTQGTSHVSVISENGDAIAMTSTINYAWGSKLMGKRTGIIFNNEMDDFSVPNRPSWSDDAWTAPSNKANWIEPAKRPLSSMSPSVVVDKDGNVRLVTGGAGGSKIITATSLTMMNNLWFNKSLSEAVFRPRLHHQLLPENLFFEPGFPQVYQEGLKKKGHTLVPVPTEPVTDSCSVDSEGRVYGFGDLRRLGGSAGY